MPYFDEPVGRVKIQKTSKNSQRYYTTKRLIRDLLSNTPNFLCVQANFADIYLRRMRDRSMRSGTELAREIQLTDWSTAGEQGKLVFVVSTTPSLAQFISLFTTGKKSSFDRLNYRSIQVFHFEISVKKKRRKGIPIDKQNFFS